MYRWVRPLLFRLDAERAHHVAIRLGRLIQRLPSSPRVDPPELRQNLFGFDFPNPVGIAAGLDKNAQCIPYWERIGCGFVEIGSVSADPAPGNPKPRAFRLPEDRALINRMGLNNDGADAIATRLRAVKPSMSTPLGVNIVKTHRPGLEGAAAVDDFCRCFSILAPLADYVALNVSCPNTDEGKTFEDPEALDRLLERVTAVRRQSMPDLPLLVKFSPPGHEDPRAGGRFKELLTVTESYDVDGYIATNTTVSREGLKTAPSVLRSIGHGGLSGRPLVSHSRALLQFLFRETSGKVPIISVGGIDSVDEAATRIYLGASLIQVYTGLVYEGPGLIRTLVDGMSKRFALDGVSGMAEARGRLV